MKVWLKNMQLHHARTQAPWSGGIMPCQSCGKMPVKQTDAGKAPASILTADDSAATG